MSDTLGSLVDKLGVTNLKIWNAQEFVYKVSRMTKEDFAKYSHEEIQSEIKKLAWLNLDRNRLMREIDECLDTSIRNGHAEIGRNVKITGGKE